MPRRVENYSEEIINTHMTSENKDFEHLVSDHYSPLLKSHGNSHLSLNWGSQTSQLKRFERLIDFPIEEDATILDVGCGLGHLFEYLRNRKKQIKYTGYDIIPDMVSEASKLFPEANFTEENILDSSEDYCYDYVVASGIFTIGCNHERMFATIDSMFKKSVKICSFNSLSAWSPSDGAHEFQADPLKVLDFCKELTPRISFFHSYLPHDFTVHLYKESFN